MRTRTTPTGPTTPRRQSTRAAAAGARSAKAALLGGLRPFAGCSRGDLETLAGLVDESRRSAGAPLTRQGGLGAEVFVIISGTVAVTRDGVPVATLGAGDVLGELALLGTGTRTATATCLTDTRFLVMDPRAFASAIDRPVVARAFRAVATSRTSPSAAPAARA